LDFTVTPQINLIEANLQSTVLMSFFPSTLMASVIGFVILASYIIEKKTEYLTLGLIAALSIEKLSSFMLFVFAAIYDS
jgi:vacuolar-type H+-ATPase subunit C/Vma6